MSTPAPTCFVSRAMRRIAKATGGGAVRVTLAEAGGFIAHAYPEREAAKRVYFDSLRAIGAASVTLDEVMVGTERALNTPLAHGRGKTAAEAVEALAAAVVVAVKA